MLGKRRRTVRSRYVATTEPTSANLSSSSAGGPSQPNASLQILREKTSIQKNGRTKQQRTVSTLVVGEEEAAPRVRPDLRREEVPVYEGYEGGDHGGGDDDADDEPSRVLRESVCCRQHLNSLKTNTSFPG